MTVILRFARNPRSQAYNCRRFTFGTSRTDRTSCMLPLDVLPVMLPFGTRGSPSSSALVEGAGDYGVQLVVSPWDLPHGS